MAYEDLAGTGLLAFAGAFIGLFVLIGAALYIYMALAWSTIARKLKHSKPWLAWIPFANISLLLQLGGFHWAWVFLMLVPVLGWLALAVLLYISMWRVFVKRNYPGWLSLVPLLSFIPVLGFLASIAGLIIVGFVAWSDRK